MSVFHESAVVEAMGFMPLDLVDVHVGRLTTKFYPKIGPAMKIWERAYTYQIAKTFINAVDMASKFQIVAPCESKHPRVVFATYLGVWCSWAGLPKAVLSDRGGEFHKEFSEELEAMNVQLLQAAVKSPTQNAACERAGGAWKFHARALIDEVNIRFTMTDSARMV